MNTEPTSLLSRSPGSICLSTPVTHSDWILHPGVEWGSEGIRHMLDQCKASGWSRVYWRVFDGGRTLHTSRYADPMKWSGDNYWTPEDPADMKYVYWAEDPPEERARIIEKFKTVDYSGFDTLAEAINYGHSIGLEVHAWVTINEDDHGWGLQSRFARENPQSRWRKRSGEFYHSQQSFAFAEVMEYKLNLIRELVDNYDLDGILLDWMRTGDVRDDPQNDADGVANYGYEDPLVQSYTEKYGIDPHSIPNGDDRWVRWRAEPQTEFIRAVRAIMNPAARPPLPLAILAQHSTAVRGAGHKIDGNLRGLLLDTALWAKEGLIDAIVAAGYYRDGGNAKQAYQHLVDETQGLIDVWLFCWVPNTPSEFEANLALARELGTCQVLFWEGDYIDIRENKIELQECMRLAAEN